MPTSKIVLCFNACCPVIGIFPMAFNPSKTIAMKQTICVGVSNAPGIFSQQL